MKPHFVAGFPPACFTYQMNTDICMPLGTIGVPDALEFGSKAAMLGELSKNGLEVPAGFALSKACFQSFLRENGFPYGPDEYAAFSSEIRECVKTYTFTSQTADLVHQCYDDLARRFSSDEIIVRTSALCEDTRSSSMAGVFESFPGLASIDEVRNAIRQCYAGLFADGVLDRYAAGHIADDMLTAGIIIQQYVAGDISGVTFTTDVKEMNPDRIIISAAGGSCSGITDGSASATIYTVNKENAELLGTRGEKQILTTDQLSELATSAAQIEAVSGYYQDIEWTFSSGTLYILQSRPVTGFKEVAGSNEWEDDTESDRSRVWTLNSGFCHPPLTGELIIESENQSGECAYKYGMDWDATELSSRHGYLYQSKREIPDAKKRIEKFFGRINGQFDKGEDEFDKHIKPELAGLIDAIHRKYIDTNLTDESLLSYLNDAEFFMKRSMRLHWRATTSEWYMGHFFRKRIEQFYDSINTQDLVDVVYSKSLMTVEREMIYEMVTIVQQDPTLLELFTDVRYDRLVAARFKRIQSDSARHLRKLMDGYSREYGWLYAGNLEDGKLCKPGEVTLVECVNRIRRYLHVSIDGYHANINQITANSKRLREAGLRACKSDTDEKLLHMAILAGEKAYLAGDNHAFYICSRRFVYVCDALNKIAKMLCDRGLIDSSDDIVYLHLAEIKNLVADDDSGERCKKLIAKRKDLHATWSLRLPPERTGPPAKDKQEEQTAGKNTTGQSQVIKGESGTRKNVRGPIHIGFPKGVPEEQVILLLEHGHEGDLATILGKVAGIILKMGTPASHMGIIARELGIPAIYGVGDKADGLRSGDVIELRGKTGEVVLA